MGSAKNILFQFESLKEPQLSAQLCSEGVSALVLQISQTILDK